MSYRATSLPAFNCSTECEGLGKNDHTLVVIVIKRTHALILGRLGSRRSQARGKRLLEKKGPRGPPHPPTTLHLQPGLRSKTSNPPGSPCWTSPLPLQPLSVHLATSPHISPRFLYLSPFFPPSLIYSYIIPLLVIRCTITQFLASL